MTPPETQNPRLPHLLRSVLIASGILLVLAVLGLLSARSWMRHAADAALPQLDGSLRVAGLTAPVSVTRDAQGVPHIRAASLDDLVLAQGYVTTQDRLFQMDLLRRHSAGELAEILGESFVAHDRLQRTLQIRASADRILAALPPQQRHLLERYTAGVNASIADQSAHLPLDFKVLSYKPSPWTPRDCLLVSLVLFQDLSNTYSVKLNREALTAKLAAGTSPEIAQALTQDLYPVGSWRDHPPSQPVTDLTIEGPPLEEVPLDETQASATTGKPELPTLSPSLIARLTAPIPSLLEPPCTDCVAGSNNWVVSGAHTASGKPMLSNDMHLAMTVPGVWYEADLGLDATAGPEPFHVAGVSVPGLPLIVAGHNQHIAWGFTNLGADVEDLYLETIRGSGNKAQFLATDGSWQPLLHLEEPIRVRGGRKYTFQVPATRHGEMVTPIISPILRNENRPIALRWTLYDASIVRIPFLEIDSAHDWPSFVAAFSTFGGPAQNVVYADDQGHIGYHAVGAIPLRGAPVAPPAATPELPRDLAVPSNSQPAGTSTTIAKNPDALAATDIKAPPVSTAAQLGGALNPVPVVPTAAREWSGYIPYDKLPSVFDPPGGVIATANARVTPDDYPYPITLNWEAPYRNERIWRLLAHRTGIQPADMLAIETDIYSDFDHVLAERLAYGLDHSAALANGHYSKGETKRLHQAADLLRNFNGRMTVDSPAAAITFSVHSLLWPALLAPRIDPGKKGLTPAQQQELAGTLYQWGEHDYALEQILMHTPPRWLPPGFANWPDFLADTVERALTLAKAPSDLASWRFGAIHTVEVSDSIFGQTRVLAAIYGEPTGTGSRPLSGDGDTVKQVGHAFGPSERLTVDLANPDRTTLNVTMGQSGNFGSPFFLDQFPAWLKGTTFPFAFSDAAVRAAGTHTLTLTP
jgi:penicillin amidase